MGLSPARVHETDRPNAAVKEVHPVLDGFHGPVQDWFCNSFAEPTRVQQLGWPVIRSGESALILAPTGSGKTLAAFLAVIDRLMFDPVPAPTERCRVLYISPLKALAVDVERNLRAPLVGVGRSAERSGVPIHEPRVAIRTGDTPSKERADFLKHPADILITTPESLYLMLTSKAREPLRHVRWVIVDEIHAMVGSKRGVHLSLTLERLEELTRPHGFQRIGLSATQRPLDEVARFLGGFAEQPEDALPRPVTIVDAGSGKQLNLRVEVPVEDMARLSTPIEIPSGDASMGERYPSIWPAIHPLILDLIRKHRSTLIFVNSRRLAERLAGALNDLAAETESSADSGHLLVRAHHGSIAREQRALIEDDLKSGRLPAMVATSSLELGIDMGAIDLVIQVEAPPSVSSALQRIGRAGHQVGVPSEGIIIPKYRGDLLACAALTRRMVEGAVEEMHMPRNALDVLAQQIVAMVAMDDWNVADIERVVRRAAPYAQLPPSMFVEVLDMLSGRYPSDDFAELRPRITWDRLGGTLHTREGSKRVAITNGGTIPDRGLYGVFLLGAEKGKGRVGELDEEMVFESHAGDIFHLGASSWRIEEITYDRVIVSPAAGEPGRMPFWHGESVGRPIEFGRAIGALSRRLLDMPESAAADLLVREHALTNRAARNLIQYLRDQQEADGVVPDDRTIVIESYQDELGDWRVCILSPFGARVHAPWAMAIGALIRERVDTDVDVLWTDDGIVVRFPEADEPPTVDAVLPDPDEVEDLVIRQLGSGGGARAAGRGSPAVALFTSRFREAAARALLLPRKHPGQRAPLWQQRKRAGDLLQATLKFGSFPIILEAYRECLRDVFDMPALRELLTRIRHRDVRVVPVTSRAPSPFAASLLFNYVANFIYEGDAPLAERRAQALSVDPAQLRELLGEMSLRELLDPDALEDLERYLGHLTPERAARHADGLHDLLIRLGDLSMSEIQARCQEPAGEWVAPLEQARRICLVPIAGERRYIAAEDAGRYRDALGIPPPQGLPDAFLEPVRDPLRDLVARYARTHGPFSTGDVARRFGIGAGAVLPILEAMARSGKVIEGEFRPGGTGREWCDSEALRMLRRKSLARLRAEVEPVEPAALGRFYLWWQHVTTPRRGQHALYDTLSQIQGAPIPASVLESQVLPGRIAGYTPRDLDMLMAGGEAVWIGVESLGQHDGRVAIYLVENAAQLMPHPAGVTGPTAVHDRIRSYLATRGASFFPQICQAAGGFPPEVLEALWDLVWTGEVTNDTLQPLRAILGGDHHRDQSPEGRARAVAARRMRPGRRAPSRSSIPAEAAGRWSLVCDLVPAASDLSDVSDKSDRSDRSHDSPTDRLYARVNQLLERYGILTREAVQAEGISGGFSSIYGVLKVMEDAGLVRRGYFVAGLGATQFAVPAAVDRLRSVREPDDELHAVLLAATDPANPYGAALPWPEAGEGRRPMRQAGASVILVDGAPAAWIARSERQLVTFPEAVRDRNPADVSLSIARLLADRVTSLNRRAILIEAVDGRPPRETSMAPAFVEAGFRAAGDGYLKRL
ncbi:MAG: DEAD/DEAH box helicase [Capsulimonadaceae bacterium]